MFCLFNPRVTLTILALAGFVGLTLAYALEYGLNLAPCPLCWYQRYILFIILFASLPFFHKKLSIRTGILIIGILYCANTLLAAYQVALEQGLIENSPLCQGKGLVDAADSLESLRSKLMTRIHVNCAKPDFYFFGLTLAFYNVLYSFALGFFAFFSLWRNHDSKRPKS